MSTATRKITCDYKWPRGCARQAGPMASWWSERREVSLNWLALGVLLAAWNASDDGRAVQTRRRPEALRGYSSVSVRAATLHLAKQCAPSTNQ
jgi:hypothetical protein